MDNNDGAVVVAVRWPAYVGGAFSAQEKCCLQEGSAYEQYIESVLTLGDSFPDYNIPGRREVKWDFLWSSNSNTIRAPWFLLVIKTHYRKPLCHLNIKC